MEDKKEPKKKGRTEKYGEPTKVVSARVPERLPEEIIAEIKQHIKDRVIAWQRK